MADRSQILDEIRKNPQFVGTRKDIANWLRDYKEIYPEDAEIQAISEGEISKILKLAGYINKKGKIIGSEEAWVQCIRNHFTTLENNNFVKKVKISLTKLAQSLVEAVCAEKGSFVVADVLRDCVSIILNFPDSKFGVLNNYPLDETFIQDHIDKLKARVGPKVLKVATLNVTSLPVQNINTQVPSINPNTAFATSPIPAVSRQNVSIGMSYSGPSTVTYGQSTFVTSVVSARVSETVQGYSLRTATTGQQTPAQAATGQQTPAQAATGQQTPAASQTAQQPAASLQSGAGSQAITSTDDLVPEMAYPY